MQWFKHDADATLDGKLRKVLLRYGTDGYAIYFHCLELIAGNISDTNITFELEHDSEVIADNLKVKSYRQDQTAIERVEEIMRFIVEEKLFEYSDGRITCFKMLKRLDSSMTSNPKMREIITSAKKNHDIVMISHDTVMQDENRQDENRQDENREIPPDKPAKSQKHKYGEYGHVLLTHDEFNALLKEWGAEEQKRMIKILDEGIETKGYKYKNCNLALRKWKYNEKNTGNGYSKPDLRVNQRTQFLDLEE